uniref:Uncharacterized protein n=1 Tax=Arundo donax TaxID=35708 RepID=A0A0A9CPH6_ARUDO
MVSIRLTASRSGLYSIVGCISTAPRPLTSKDTEPTTVHLLSRQGGTQLHVSCISSRLDSTHRHPTSLHDTLRPCNQLAKLSALPPHHLYPHIISHDLFRFSPKSILFFDFMSDYLISDANIT